jgi:hypothetical protein
MGYYPVDRVEIRRETRASTSAEPYGQRGFVVRYHVIDIGGPDGTWYEEFAPGSWDRPELALEMARKHLVELAM